MTINNTAVRTQVQGNSAQTVWNYNFEVPAPGDAQLWLTQISTDTTVQVSGPLFTMTGIGSANGGTFTYPLSGAGISSDYKLTLVRTAPYANLTALANQAGYYPQSVEEALDFLAMQTQQLDNKINQAIRLPLWDTSMDALLSKAALPGAFLGFDGSGNPIPVAGVMPPSVIVTPYMETLLDDANAAAARTTLGGTTVGQGVFTAADNDAALVALGVGATGHQLFEANTPGVARTAIGATATGSALITAVDANAARTAVGATATGSALITAANAAAGRTAIEAPAVPSFSSGPGNFLLVAPGDGLSVTLPAGGSWAFFIFRIDNSNGTFDGNVSASVSVGGTLIGVGLAGRSWIGFCWRYV